MTPTQLAALRAVETGLHVTELEARWLTARGLIDASHKLTARGLKTLRAHLGEDKPYDPNDFGGGRRIWFMRGPWVSRSLCAF